MVNRAIMSKSNKAIKISLSNGVSVMLFIPLKAFKKTNNKLISSKFTSRWKSQFYFARLFPNLVSAALGGY
jgi:hypothetical protein